MSHFKASKIVTPKYKPVKVKQGTTPLHFHHRKHIEIIEGGYYYVSFGNNIAIRCVVISLPKAGENPEIISIQVNGKNKCIYKNELGLTPEQAVKNQVTG